MDLNATWPLQILNGLLVAVLIPMLRGIYRELHTINNRTAVLEERVTGQIRLDDERWEVEAKELERMRQVLERRMR